MQERKGSPQEPRKGQDYDHGHQEAEESPPTMRRDDDDWRE